MQRGSMEDGVTGVTLWCTQCIANPVSSKKDSSPDVIAEHCCQLGARACVGGEMVGTDRTVLREAEQFILAFFYDRYSSDVRAQLYVTQIIEGCFIYYDV